MIFFFFNDTATTEIFTLSLHDPLPLFPFDHAPRVLGVDPEVVVVAVRRGDLHERGAGVARPPHTEVQHVDGVRVDRLDRKSTRLNSSHANISYAVFCLKKKNITTDVSI